MAARCGQKYNIFGFRTEYLSGCGLTSETLDTHRSTFKDVAEHASLCNAHVCIDSFQQWVQEVLAENSDNV